MDSRSVPELAKAVAVTGAPTGLQTVLSAGLAGMAGIGAALARKPRQQPEALPQPDRRSFSVTELDDYLACPYDYYLKHVLGIEPLEEVSEDISPRDRGSRVHGILKKFYEEWREPVTQENRGRARELLLSLAEKAFSAEADTFRNRREKQLFATTISERFLSSEIEFWAQGFRPAYLEQKVDDFTLTLSGGRAVTLNAKIDRIDLDGNGNYIIVDYKTGKYPQPRNGTDHKTA